MAQEFGETTIEAAVASWAVQQQMNTINLKLNQALETTNRVYFNMLMHEAFTKAYNLLMYNYPTLGEKQLLAFLFVNRDVFPTTNSALDFIRQYGRSASPRGSSANIPGVTEKFADRFINAFTNNNGNVNVSNEFASASSTSTAIPMKTSENRPTLGVMRPTPAPAPSYGYGTGYVPTPAPAPSYGYATTKLKVHSPSTCGQDFQDLARILNGHIQSGRYDEVVNQIQRCIDARIQDNMIKSQRFQNPGQTKSHNKQIDRLQTLLAMIQAIGAHKLASISWNQREDNFSVTPKKYGGKSKSRKAKKSKRRHTRKH
jgi:hypothetical protein